MKTKLNKGIKFSIGKIYISEYNNGFMHHLNSAFSSTNTMGCENKSFLQPTNHYLFIYLSINVARTSTVDSIPITEESIQMSYPLESPHFLSEYKL